MKKQDVLKALLALRTEAEILRDTYLEDDPEKFEGCAGVINGIRACIDRIERMEE